MKRIHSIEEMREYVKLVDKETNDRVQRWHLKTNRGHHYWYKNVPIGIEMMAIDMDTLNSKRQMIDFTLSYET